LLANSIIEKGCTLTDNRLTPHYVSYLVQYIFVNMFSLKIANIYPKHIGVDSLRNNATHLLSSFYVNHPKVFT